MPGIIHSARQKIYSTVINLAFSALTLLVGRQEGYSARKKYEGWWRWTLASPDGVVPSRMVSVSASVNRPLHHKVQKFSSGTGSPGLSWRKGHKTVVVLHCGKTPKRMELVFGMSVYHRGWLVCITSDPPSRERETCSNVGCSS